MTSGQAGGTEVPGVLPVTVAVPTIGRPELLRGLLESLAGCRPRAAEIIVVDQSEGLETERVVRDFDYMGARRVHSDVIGVGRARNIGLSGARHQVVLFTDDDCTVATDWVGRAWAHFQRDAETIVTGRVLPTGDPAATPSLMTDEAPRDYSGSYRCNVLFSNNMALPRDLALSAGGFDERLPNAEDNDFCYRWLRSGGRLFYRPELVVWHQDWRSQEELRALYVRYGWGQGVFYGKHLRRRDAMMAWFLLRDLAAVSVGVGGAVLNRRPILSAWRRGVLRGTLPGVVEGWRSFGPRGSVGSIGRTGGPPSDDS